jgi:hypothetical protein
VRIQRRTVLRSLQKRLRLLALFSIPRRVQRQDNAVLPNFLVIGAPRSGTSWIDKNLRAHPQIFMPEHKELHFFDRHYERGIAYYEAFFSRCNGSQIAGEATPDYMHGVYSTQDIPRLIKKHLPNAKLIASLRNPVDRAYSRYWNSKAKYDRNINLSFEEKLKDRPEFIQEGFYFDQLKRFYELFPRENILVLLYDDLVADPRSFMRRIYEFLGVNADFESGFESVTVNAAAGKRNLAKSKVLWLVSRALSWMRMHSLAERLREANSVQQPPMSAATRKALVGIYREKNLQLQELINRDLGEWNH